MINDKNPTRLKFHISFLTAFAIGALVSPCGAFGIDRAKNVANEVGRNSSNAKSGNSNVRPPEAPADEAPGIDEFLGDQAPSTSGQYAAKKKVEEILNNVLEPRENWALDGRNETARALNENRDLLVALRKATDGTPDKDLRKAITEKESELREEREQLMRTRVNEIMTSTELTEEEKLAEAAALLDVDMVGKGVYPPKVKAAYEKASTVWRQHQGPSATRRGEDGLGLNPLFHEVTMMSLFPNYLPESRAQVDDQLLMQANRTPEGRALIKGLPKAYSQRLFILEMREKLK